MARSRYPRPGHRLAPATLRELLQVPVPAKYLKRVESRESRVESKEDTHPSTPYSPLSTLHSPLSTLLLCDLDETAWDRFGQQVCRQLAREVIRAVGRAIRMPAPVKDRRLPAIPRGMTLVDLELEIRTLNCLVSARIHQRPQDFQKMTIGGLLGLRGFWAKSLVDLLCSLEYVIDHPQARKATRTDALIAVKHLQAGHRYPRVGHRLAPQTLKEVLLERIPSSLVRGTRFRQARLCDLDETVWEHLTPARIGRLAGLILFHAGAAVGHSIILERRLPKPPPGMRLDELRLENRTYGCLHRAGYGRRSEGLGGLTVGQLLAIKGFGAKCLVDLLTSLENRVSREGRLDKRLTAAARALANIPQAQGIQFTDPRLGGLLRAMDTESNTVAEFVRHILQRRLDPPTPLRLREQIGELCDRIRQFSSLPLEEELVQVFAPACRARDRQILVAYYGWDGRGGRTLEALGRKHGLSRERIRQICARTIKQDRGTTVFAPVLDRALALLAKRLPRALEDLQAEFDVTGLSASHLPVESVQQAAALLSRSAGFAIINVAQSRLAVHPKQAQTLRLVVETARQVVGNCGAARLAELAAALAPRSPQKLSPTLLRQTLQTLSDHQWLDKNRNWFRLGWQPHYGLPNMIDKVLSVVGRMEVSELRSTLARYRRSRRQPPPPRILLEFCRQMPGIRVQKNLVVADPPRDWRKTLTGIERCMVEVLFEHGPLMERTAFEELCARKGMNRFSFNAIVTSSTVVAQYGRGVYGLPGLKVSRKTLRELLSRKPSSPPKHVLRAFGRAADGSFYLAYRLSRAAISGGVVTVPAAMRRHLRGKFTLRTDQGHDVGTLVAKRGCGWGLGPALRRGHAQQGDHLLLLFDPAKRQAHIHIGDEKLLQRATNS